MQRWHAGIVERLRVSRAGHFSCPVLAGVVFLAHFDGDAVSSPQEVFDAFAGAPISPVVTETHSSPLPCGIQQLTCSGV